MNVNVSRRESDARGLCDALVPGRRNAAREDAYFGGRPRRHVGEQLCCRAGSAVQEGGAGGAAPSRTYAKATVAHTVISFDSF